MKTLSVAVPCYNSEAYMNKCLDSLLESGEGIEILIINDGSTDRTKEIADSYANRFSNRVRVFHQNNAGHGGAVNTGIKNAQGQYFKVVDSDDWVNPKALMKAVSLLRDFSENNDFVDMFLADFVYDKVGAEKKRIMNYRGTVPEDSIVGWSEIGRFHPGKYILMHSVIYNINTLKRSGLELPQHTFYVDNLFVYQPLPYVKRIYYMSECIYHYFIGRDEQSVNEDVMIRRIDQQLLVNRLMMECVNLNSITEKSKYKYMLNYLTIITAVSTLLLIKAGTEEAICKKESLWEYIRERDLKLYLKMRFSILGNVLHLPGNIGKKITLFIYRQAQRIVGFN